MAEYRGIRLKACPRCQGDCYDEWGSGDWTCLNCGWVGEAPRPLQAEPPSSERRNWGGKVATEERRLLDPDA